MAIARLSPRAPQRLEQAGEPDGGRRRREQPVLSEPRELFDPGDSGKAVGGRGAVRGDDGAACGRHQGERLPVELDLAAEDGEVGAVETALLDPGDESGTVETRGQRADHRFVERVEAEVGAQIGTLGEAVGDLLAEQRDRMDERDAAHAGMGGGGGVGGGADERPMPARFASQSAGPESA